MSWRGTAPVQLVIMFIGSTIILDTFLIGILSWKQVEVPQVLGTVTVASVTGLLGLLAPNTGLLHRHSPDAEAAGQAAAMAVLEHKGLRDLQREADYLLEKDPEKDRGKG